MFWPLALAFLRCLITGELWKLWQEHKEQVKAQAVADSPTTDEELHETLQDGRG